MAVHWTSQDVCSHMNRGHKLHKGTFYFDYIFISYPAYQLPSGVTCFTCLIGRKYLHIYEVADTEVLNIRVTA